MLCRQGIIWGWHSPPPPPPSPPPLPRGNFVPPFGNFNPSKLNTAHYTQPPATPRTPPPPKMVSDFLQLPADECLVNFSHRLRRSPRQSVRHLKWPSSAIRRPGRLRRTLRISRRRCVCICTYIHAVCVGAYNITATTVV